MEYIDSKKAREIIGRYSPIFKRLEEHAIDYCLVGGLGVMTQSLKTGSDWFRLTEDADILVPGDLRISEFVRLYLDAYSSEGTTSTALYEALFGETPFEELDVEDEPANFSVIGANPAIDGFSTPSFDVCKMLNEKTVGDIERERIKVGDTEVWVATVPELLDMKRKTTSLYRATPTQTARPQDFVDMEALEGMLPDQQDEDPSSQRPGIFGKILGSWMD